MSKIPRPERNELIRYLIRKGFSTKSQSSHVKLKQNDVTVIVPAGNKSIKPGLLLKILRTVEISRDEFIADHDGGIVK